MSDTVKTGAKRDLSTSPSCTNVLPKKARSQSPATEKTEESTKNTEKGTTSARRLPKGVKKHRRKLANVELCSHEDVHWREVIDLLGREVVDQVIKEGREFDAPFSSYEEVTLTVDRISSNGDGLALAPKPCAWVVIVPFSLPGEKVKARIYRNARLHSFADFLGVDQPNASLRDMSRVECRYFGLCGGCQYQVCLSRIQMLDYDTQLAWKRDVVVRAYEKFSALPASAIPVVISTFPSPLQYGYRTKITPHFDAPQKSPRRRKGVEQPPSLPLLEGATVPIGFNKAGKREVMDIEECPIATPTINSNLGPLRRKILDNLHTYKKGASLLLRESLPLSSEDSMAEANVTHTCITDHRGKVRERVGDMLFEYGASSFFQNNNSILEPLVDYVRAAIFSEGGGNPVERPILNLSHLVDTYCGAGLFSIMLSSSFEKIAGIELSTESIAAATNNARINEIPEGKISFRAGDAANIFSAVTDFPPAATAVIVDPPRKGCDEKFIDQLLQFRCSTVVYVSCNVHTQARDVGLLINKSEEQAGRCAMLGRYVLDSIRGFDLFPQTAHVESVAVLRLLIRT